MYVQQHLLLHTAVSPPLSRAWMWPGESTSLSGSNACVCRRSVCCLHAILRILRAQVNSHRLRCSIISYLSDRSKLPTSVQDPHPGILKTWMEGWAIPFPDWPPHQAFFFAYKMWEKTQWGKCDLCWQRREAARGDAALFRAQMPVDKTLLVYISWSLGGLTFCSQGFIPVPMPELAHTT